MHLILPCRLCTVKCRKKNGTLSWRSSVEEVRKYLFLQLEADLTCNLRRVLITTDVWARGIDVQQVSLVINYDLPA